MYVMQNYLLLIDAKLFALNLAILSVVSLKRSHL